MRIVHLSDFHLDKGNISDCTKIRDYLRESLEKINQERKIDLIIFTGDLINIGGKSYENIKQAFMGFEYFFIDYILQNLSIPRSNFIFTIGNHDTDRQADSKRIETGLYETLTSIEEVNKFYDEKTTEGIQRVLPFKKFEQKFYSAEFENDKICLTNFDSCFILEIDNKSIGIASINSSWRCYDSSKDKGRILFGEKQIQHAITYIQNCDIKIAISHHHYNWVADFEHNIIEKEINSAFDIYFCGHTHSNKANYCEMPNGKMFTFTAPGILAKNQINATKEYTNGFSVIDYNLDTASIESRFYIQDYPSSFKIDTSIGDNGVWKLRIPLGEEAILKLQKQQVILDIKEELPVLNEHLLTYDTHTNAPKSIQEIFVMPNLVVASDIDDENSAQEITVKELGEIICSDKNYVIFGIKEVGKTVLLDKILYDILNEHTNKNYIPVLLNFQDIVKDIESKIRTYWKKNRLETTNILNNENVILLIDNLSFLTEDESKLVIISDFIKQYPKTRFIATSLLLVENDFHIDSELQDILKFEKINLRQFKAKQIRHLISKWFPNATKHENPKKMETIVSAFETLNLPRTPFAVSMFLWIIERQQAYRPQNNATLIEKFIEEILDKKSIRGTFRETFDYENKISLLAEIAYHMLKHNNVNYSLPHSELIKCAESHLEIRRFTGLYNSRKIIAELLKLGIFVETNSDIKFRFNCFFEYFLVKKMQYDPTFKQEVLKEENYLNYTNELDYYTGLNRGEKEILKTIVSRLEYDYIDVNDIVFSKVKSIDDFFNIDKSVFTRIKVDDILNLLPEKQTEEDAESMEDAKLEHCEKGEVIIKKKDSNKYLNYGKLLLLAMKVLKNSEEIDQENLKYESYEIILKNSISYAILYKMIGERILEYADRFPKERVDDFKVTLRFLPVLHQILISNNIGTFKLAQVIKEKIESDLRNKTQVSEFERFLSLFLYSDIKGQNYKECMNTFIKSINKAYIADSCLLKLMEYYYESDNVNDDKTIINQLADLYIKVNSEMNTTKRLNKGVIMQNYEKKKRKYLQDRNNLTN